MSTRKAYRCRLCGKVKKGHVCLVDAKNLLNMSSSGFYVHELDDDEPPSKMPKTSSRTSPRANVSSPAPLEAGASAAAAAVSDEGSANLSLARDEECRRAVVLRPIARGGPFLTTVSEAAASAAAAAVSHEAPTGPHANLSSPAPLEAEASAAAAAVSHEAPTGPHANLSSPAPLEAGASAAAAAAVSDTVSPHPDGYSNTTAPCPAGLEWVEEKNGYNHEMKRWAKFGRETKALMYHKKDDIYWPLDATDIAAKGEEGFLRLRDKRYQTHKEGQKPQGSSALFPTSGTFLVRKRPVRVEVALRSDNTPSALIVQYPQPRHDVSAPSDLEALETSKLCSLIQKSNLSSLIQNSGDLETWDTSELCSLIQESEQFRTGVGNVVDFAQRVLKTDQEKMVLEETKRSYALLQKGTSVLAARTIEMEKRMNRLKFSILRQSHAYRSALDEEKKLNRKMKAKAQEMEAALSRSEERLNEVFSLLHAKLDIDADFAKVPNAAFWIRHDRVWIEALCDKFIENQPPILQGTSSDSASDKGGGASVVPAGASDVPVNPYQQGDKDFCVSYGTANALSRAGDHESAAYIAAIAQESSTARDPLMFVQQQCYKFLQPGWTTVKLPNAKAIHPLQLDQTRVTVIQIEDGRKFTGHAIAIFGGYILDSNKTHPIPLTRGGLDACCFKGDGFGKVVKGFQLIPQPKSKVAAALAKKRKACADV